MITTLQRTVVLHMGWYLYRAPYGGNNNDNNEDGVTNDEKTVEAALNWPPSHFLN